MRKVAGFGPDKADIVIVGEAPGSEEELQGKPFVGAAGWELGNQLAEAGIRMEDCYITNACKYRPPNNKMDAWLVAKGKKAALEAGYTHSDGRWAHPLVMEGKGELRDEILAHEPKVIVTLGNTALWALKGIWGISDWRGSEMVWNDIPLVPTYHPASILRQWENRPQAVLDLQYRVKRRLDHGFDVRRYLTFISPDLHDVRRFVSKLGSWISVDIETCSEKVVCIGIGSSLTTAMCIPILTEHGPYWSAAEEAEVWAILKQKLENSCIVGQNYSYDAQYLEVNHGIQALAYFDTYVAESVLFPGNPRGLGYLSSIYCDWHCYWKDDAKDWSKVRNADAFRQLYEYNCRDVCAPIEIMQQQRRLLEASGLMKQFEDRMAYMRNVYAMMRRGVKRDKQVTKQMDDEVEEILQSLRLSISEVAGHDVNPASPAQVKKLLYTEMGLKNASESTDAETLEALSEKYPGRAEIITAVSEHRSLASLRSNFLKAKLDGDGLLRSSWMATGTETFRLTSSKNAFGRGCNLQNVTAGKQVGGLRTPNLRKCLVPDNGYTFFDCDLARADLQVVVWEADDADLKWALRNNLDMHLVNAIDLFGIKGVSMEECSESHPNYPDVLAKLKEQRRFAKTFVHLTDYGGKERTCAIKCGCTVHEASQGQKRWFAAHPGIQRWHRRTAAMLAGTRTIKNTFGFRRVYFDRPDSVLNEALAWNPQSTIALVISYIHEAFDLVPNVEVLLQGHDSIAGQYLTKDESLILPAMYEASKIVVPYQDPLIIPLELKISTESWGACDKLKADDERRKWWQ